MSDFVQFLTGNKSFIETGTVEDYFGNGKYRVTVGGQQLIIRSALDAWAFTMGDRVIINRVGDLRYIVGATGQSNTVVEKEIVINA
jgi:hypothetical protein